MVVLTSSISDRESPTLVYLFALDGHAQRRDVRPSPLEAAESGLRLREWLDTHRDQAIVIISLVAGLWLMGNSLYLLVTAEASR